MTTTELLLETETTARAGGILTPSPRRHFGAGRRRPTWKVLGATVAGFPGFLWQLTRRVQN